VPTAQPLGSDDPRIGALFATDGYGSHFCTASVVRSPGHDLLMTAAHCISNGDDQGNLGIVFIPGYADGTAPYGVWTPRALIVDPRWAHGGNPAYDVGFVVLNPSNDGKNIQDVLGANQVDFNAPSTRLVRVTGYPERDNTPVTCQNWATRYSSGQLRFSCGGFYGGTSGSPWIIASSAGQAAPQVVGVIGGYQKGGDTNSVSYCVYLGSAIKALYEQAQAIGTSPGVTSPGPVPAAS
jgi:V8-like Glu-specific endopeptidase